MVTLYGVTMKPFGAHGHATAKRDHATRLFTISGATRPYPGVSSISIDSSRTSWPASVSLS
jgi:hypothetical protein